MIKKLLKGLSKKIKKKLLKNRTKKIVVNVHSVHTTLCGKSHYDKNKIIDSYI